MFRVCWATIHTLSILAVVASLLTGFRISLLTRDDALFLSPVLPQGDVHSPHVLSGMVLTLCFLTYLAYKLRAKNTNVGRKKYHRILISLSLPLITISVISGWGIYHFSDIPYVQLVHYYAATAILLFVLFHSGGYVVDLGKASISWLKALFVRPFALVIIGLFSVLVMGLWQWNLSPTPLSVSVLPDDDFIVLDGDASDPAWTKALSETVSTFGGANFIDGKTQVTVKALRTDKEAFFLFQWEDPSKSLNHLPLVKTEQGWTVRQNGFYQFDEQTYYEDKFAVLLSDHCNLIAAGTVHLGRKPLTDKPANWHGKGYHYTTDGEYRDMWHWKAVRTNGMKQADDNYFGPPEKHSSANRRYKAGYHTDSKESGGYVMNWKWFQQDEVVPKRLPLQTGLNLDSSIADDAGLVGSWFDFMPYRRSADTLPIGATLPSVLYRSNQFEGDRGDVSAVGQWRNGKWTLEMARHLDTESAFDQPIHDGICLWVSAFDHSQTAHTRHIRPIKLVFGE
ncbi:hypothetical protein A8L45_07905 [Veronia pacifica]|uniref:Cytochrome c-552/DMSO reductase-like haem-binding domain-containing protein n=1 Tax=Veronia pacifica TaxID=1080227 RepID=A0A1C3ELE4_9GAMM|nr:hypothetical protein A8L45_07905 [Veronia pacifica]